MPFLARVLLLTGVLQAEQNHERLRVKLAWLGVQGYSPPGLKVYAMNDASNMDSEPITRLIHAWKGGDTQASEALFDKIYPVLRQIAARQLAKQGSDLTLETSDLIHETYMRMLDIKKSEWSGSAHFFAVASQVVRFVIIDHARHRNRKKRGGEIVKVGLPACGIGTVDTSDDWLALDQALTELSARHPLAAKVVELRYFGGMNNEEISSVISLSTATVVRHWRFARAWLKQVLRSNAIELRRTLFKAKGVG